MPPPIKAKQNGLNQGSFQNSRGVYILSPILFKCPLFLPISEKRVGNSAITTFDLYVNIICRPSSTLFEPHRINFSVFL